MFGPSGMVGGSRRLRGLWNSEGALPWRQRVASLLDRVAGGGGGMGRGGTKGLKRIGTLYESDDGQQFIVKGGGRSSGGGL